MGEKHYNWMHDLMPVRTRQATDKVLEMIEAGLLDPKDVVLMCLKWMSEDSVKEMCEANEIDLDRKDEEEI